MDDPPATRMKPGDHLLWMHLFVAVVSALVVFAKILEVAGCSDRCNYPVLEVASHGFWRGDFTAFIITAGLYLFLRSRLRLSWIIPAIGITVTLVGGLIAYVAINSALITG